MVAIAIAVRPHRRGASRGATSPPVGRPGLERERGRGGRALRRDRVDLSQEHGEQFLLGHSLVQLTSLEDDPLAAPAGDADVGVASVLRISWATRTSSRGSEVASDTRMVSPMPSLSRIPMPTALRMLPASTGPDSVTPRWTGYARAAANLRFAMMLVHTSVDFSETLMKPGP